MDEIDRPATGGLDATTDLSFELRRRERIGLVRAPGRHAEALDVAIGKVAQDRLAERLDRTLGPPGPPEVGDAEDTGQSLLDLPPVGIVAQHELDPPHERTHAGDTDIRRGSAQVADQALDEPGAIPPLERDFLIANDD